MTKAWKPWSLVKTINHLSGEKMMNESPSIESVIREIAPYGKLRAAINYGNAVLVQRNASTGELKGVSVALAKELARRFDLPLEMVPYNAAGKVVEALSRNEWDVAFLAVDPKRAADIYFTKPYVIIEGSFLVPVDSPYQRNDEMDQEGIRIAVGKNAAYDLFLSRTFKNAELVRAATSPEAVDLFLEQKLEAAAGIRKYLVDCAESTPGLRVIDGRFMVIEQAMCVPVERKTAGCFLDLFIDEMITGGFIRKKLDENGQADVTVAPVD